MTARLRLTIGGIAAVACLGLAPATAKDEHPDFTGLWTTYRPVGAQPFRGGSFTPPVLPKLTPAGQAKYDVQRKLTQGTNYSPGLYCVGSGMPGSMLGSGPYPMELIQRPEQITVIYEAHGEMRHIYFGDRVPDKKTVFPERNGRSVGHWDGDTLVIDTDSLVEQEDSFYAHSDQATVEERYTLATEDDGKGGMRKVITASLTLKDPVFLAEPYTTEKKWQEVPNGHLMTYECTEPQWLEAIEQLKAGKQPPAPLGAEAPKN
jgi:hypothetical protein